MEGREDRAGLNGLEKKLFKLMAKGATKTQWAEWLRAPLEHALANGDKKLVMTLLKAGADGGAGWEGCAGRTLLGAAVEGGNREVVSAILEAGGLEELDTVSGEEGMTPIHHAVAGGHTDAARALILAGADVGLLDGRDRSALHYAVEGGYLQVAEDVIIGGAALNAEDADGDTPLHLAAAHDDQAFVSTLLRRGASVDATNKKGQHPLHLAIEHDRVAVAEALLKAGADPDVFYDGDSSPLFLARRSLVMTQTLLEHDADVKAVDDEGYTPLHWAAQTSKAEVVEALVEAGADVEAQSGKITFYNLRDGGDFEKLTPLHVAAMRCNLGGMSALLHQGADINAVDEDLRTPLHLLCELSAPLTTTFSGMTADTADLLLRWGADQTLTDNDGHTPEQLIERVELTEPVRRVLANVSADRAWRRRGMLVMCRAFPDKIPTKGGEGRAGKAGARRGRRSGGGSVSGGRGRGNVLARVVELEDDALFRKIVGFL